MKKEGERQSGRGGGGGGGGGEAIYAIATHCDMTFD